VPLIYGRFIEIIYGQRHISWLNIFQKHWFNFVIVKFIILIPLFIFLFFQRVLNTEIPLFNSALSQAIDILGIYIIPLVFISHKKISSISLGVKCLIGNFKFSLPLVFLSLSSLIFDSLSTTLIHYTIYPVLVSLSYLFLLELINLTVFITASFILKSKLIHMY
jgi:hypothetical protein